MKQLVAYITSGYPDTNFTVDLALALGENGVDSLELGVPFSDPVADGPVIEKANHLSLERGFKFAQLLEMTKVIAPQVDTLWMGYFNSFYQQNFPELLKKANELQLSGMIIPDLPHEEALAYTEDFKKSTISNISFVAPTDSDERIKKVISDSEKFIYLVAYAGITGAGHSEDLQETIESIRKYTQTPLYVGFGVNEKTAREKVKGVDGVIVGSAFVNVLLDESKTLTQKINACTEISRNIKSIINE